MTNRSFPSVRRLAPLLLAATSGVVGSATMIAAQASPPVAVHRVVVKATSDSTALTTVSATRQLSDGRVIANDADRHRLLLFEPTLKSYRVLADTSAGAPQGYGPGGSGALIEYLGDSSVFVDLASSALLVIDGQGKFVRSMAAVRSSDLSLIAFGKSRFDQQGRLIYRAFRVPLDPVLTKGPVYSTLIMPDTAPILRMDFEARTVDTIARLKTAYNKVIVVNSGAIRPYQAWNPVPVNDGWAAMADGSLAIVREHDYHVDWLDSRGTLRSTPRVPYEWRPLTMAAKQAIVDSVKNDTLTRNIQTIIRSPTATGASALTRPFVVMEPAELPDYLPAFHEDAVHAAPDGRVWILPTTSVTSSAGLTYDVISRDGILAERVLLPKGRALVGFGRDGSVYMKNVIAAGRSALERGSVVR